MGRALGGVRHLSLRPALSLSHLGSWGKPLPHSVLAPSFLGCQVEGLFPVWSRGPLP